MFDSLLLEARYYIETGGMIMPLLAGLAVLLWFALGYRMAALRRGSRSSVRALLDKARQGELEESRGLVEDAVLRGLELQKAGKPHLRRFLDDAFGDYDQELKRYRITIRTVVSVAPVLGLLGTVTGMIETFNSLGDMTLFSQTGGIAGGISQALFTTQLGLAVAIPGLLVKGMLDRRQKSIEMELAQLKDLLCSSSPA